MSHSLRTQTSVCTTLIATAILCASVTPRAEPIATLSRESAEPRRSEQSPSSNTPCPLASSTNGNAANYRWYNVCSGYIWIFSEMAEEHVGVMFGGAAQPEVRGGNIVKRAITYFRNVGYGYTADVFLDVDNEGDGCPDGVLATQLNMEPGLRWNCSNFNTEIPCEVEHVIVRAKPDYCYGGPYCGIVSFATDGPYTAGCAPNTPPRSFYYGLGAQYCLPWRGPNDDPDNFLFWLIVDAAPSCPPNSATETSWGSVKRLYQ